MLKKLFVTFSSGKTVKVFALATVLVWAVIVAGCGPVSQNKPATPAPVNSGYPGSDQAVDSAYPGDSVEGQDGIETPSPAMVPGGYPPSVEEPTIAFSEPRFKLDPLPAQGTEVTGQAPPEVLLAVVDITFNGVVLGTGRSRADGTYQINVSPLPGGHRIGLTVAELESGKTYSDMAEEYFPHRGDGFMNVPNLGVFFDTGMVTQ